MANTLLDLVKSTHGLLIDVRTLDEWNEGHAKGALHWELGSPLRQAITTLPKDMPIFTYCRSGARSEQAKQILIDEGFVNVTNSGGLDEVLTHGSELETS